MCRLIFSTLIFGYISPFVFPSLVVTASLVCNLYSCCLGVQVILILRLAPSEGVKFASVRGVPEDESGLPQFSGGVLMATSDLPYHSTLGEASERGGEPLKQASDNSTVPNLKRKKAVLCAIAGDSHLSMRAALPPSIGCCKNQTLYLTDGRRS